MKPTLFSTLFIWFAFTAISPGAKQALITSSAATTKVWICDSEGAKKYHLTKNCRGLNNCKHDLIYVTLKEAIKKGKPDLCGWED